MTALSKRAALAIALLGAMAAGSARDAARADAIDPRLAARVTVGPPRGPSPMARIDAARTGRARDLLPKTPRLIWHHALNEALDLLSLAVDDAGTVTIASTTSPMVTELANDGSERWRVHVGSPVVSGPVLLSDGTRFVLTTAGQAVAISKEGAVRFRAELASGARPAHVAPMPLDDGGVLVVSGTEVDEMAADGSLRATTQLPERPVGALVRTSVGVVVTCDTGSVYRIRPPEPAHLLGTLEGDPGAGAAFARERTLVAVVDHRRLVALDLRTGVATTLFGAAVASIDGPVALGPAGERFVTTFRGTLLGIDETGKETRRSPLEGGKGDGSAGPPTVAESPPVTSDREGRVGFARAAGAMGTVGPDGAVTIAEDASCTAPVALAPAGPRRMVVACRDGLVLMMGD